MSLTLVSLETDLKVNRTMMDPHFVFNALNTLQNFILDRNFDDANQYLVRFSQLLRKLIEYNMADSITLEAELDILKRYVEIENLRFSDSLSVTFEIDPNLDIASSRIPVMMLQPLVENAIWHGLLPKTASRTLKISISRLSKNLILCKLVDNGVGFRERAGHEKRPASSTEFIRQRLNLLNNLYNLTCDLSMHCLPDNAGTEVTLTVPDLFEVHARTKKRIE